VTDDGGVDDEDLDDWESDDHGPIDKPDELLALHGATQELFDLLKDWFAVEDRVAIDLREVDSAVAELGDPYLVAALAMRKLQALHLLATPGVRTTTDVVVAIINDLERALVQAPNMWLKRRAAATDWDDEFALLTDGPSPHPGHPSAGGDGDEIDRFRSLHTLLHDALFAVVDASDGEIRELE
jgi:hypothetical protein